MQIETVRLKNYKAFKDVFLADVPRMCILVGANGSGKTSFFDVFGFLKDCLTHNVTKALQRRGGFREVLFRGAGEECIEIEIQFRSEINRVNRLVTYKIQIGHEAGKAVVLQESLRYKRGRHGHPAYALNFSRGKGWAVANEEDFNDETKVLDREEQTLDSTDILAIKGLGQFQRFKAANAFRQLIENWHVSNLQIDHTRASSEIIGDDDHLTETGANLQLVARNLYENHLDTFTLICDILRRRVPGISSVEPHPTPDGRILLKFGDGAFKDPFIDKFVSDGTIKMFAYLVLLHDPRPHPLLCVEEPENQLYPSLMQELAEEFRQYALRGGQVFISTHSPDFLNGAELDEVFWLVKRAGATNVHRAKDDPQIAAYMRNGDKMGYLWKHGLFDGADPS